MPAKSPAIKEMANHRFMAADTPNPTIPTKRFAPATIRAADVRRGGTSFASRVFEAIFFYRIVEVFESRGNAEEYEDNRKPGLCGEQPVQIYADYKPYNYRGRHRYADGGKE